MDQPNPYAPPKSQVLERVEVDAPLVPAGRGQRLAAVLIDGTLILLVLGAALWFEFSVLWDGKLAPARGTEFLLVQFANSLLGLASYVLFNGVLLDRYGQTIGKRLLDIRIARLDGSKPSLTDLLLRRYLVFLLIQYVPYLGALINLADPLLIFRSDRRCLHDFLAGTIVVKA